MQRPFLRLILVIFLGMVSPVSAGEAMGLPEVGDTMTYALSNGDLASSAVVGIEEEQAQCVARIVGRITRAGGRQETQRYALIYTSEAVGLAMAFPDCDNVDLRISPLILYLNQAGVEDTWMAQNGTMTVYDEDDNPSAVRFFVIGRLERIEPVTVRAGRFQGCRKESFTLRTESDRQASKTRLTIWYHPSVGIIKTRTEQGGRVLETELVSYSRKRG